MTKSALSPNGAETPAEGSRSARTTTAYRRESGSPCTPSPTLEAMPTTIGDKHPCHHHHGGRSRPYVRAGRTFGNRSIQGRRSGAARSLGPLPRLLLGDAHRVVLRIPLAPLVRRLRLVRAVPVPAVHVRAHAVWAPVDLRPVRERFGCRVAGEA